MFRRLPRVRGTLLAPSISESHHALRGEGTQRMKRFATWTLTVGVVTIALAAGAQQTTPPSGSTTTPGGPKCPDVASGAPTPGSSTRSSSSVTPGAGPGSIPTAPTPGTGTSSGAGAVTSSGSRPNLGGSGSRPGSRSSV